MKFDILTLFPDAVYGYCSESILGRAQEKNLINITAHNFRDYSDDKHHKVDDAPYGGGAGMVLRPQPIYNCLKNIGVLKKESFSVIPVKTGIHVSSIIDSRSGSGMTKRSKGCVADKKDKKTKIIIMDPDGKKFDQAMAQKFSKLDRLVLICGRYQGFDERIYKFVDEKVSVGDFVLSGGELPAMTIVEATARLLPGVLGNQESLNNETFSALSGKKDSSVASLSQNDNHSIVIPLKKGIQKNGFPIKSGMTKCGGKTKKGEHALYTRPENFLGLKVPKVLLSGNHKKIEEWRKSKGN